LLHPIIYCLLTSLLLLLLPLNTQQDANILIGRRQHGAHHKPNFEGNYSIVSGWWNTLLDSTNFFRWLEHRVVDATGVEPRCWYAPDHEWAEQVQPGQQS
jgi:ubiquitin-conjugating enzyme E2 variant